MNEPDILIPKDRYSKVRGKLFFFESRGLDAQCAYCLYIQHRTFVKNDEGLIIGLDIPDKDQSHAENCKQK